MISDLYVPNESNNKTSCIDVFECLTLSIFKKTRSYNCTFRLTRKFEFRSRLGHRFQKNILRRCFFARAKCDIYVFSHIKYIKFEHLWFFINFIVLFMRVRCQTGYYNSHLYKSVMRYLKLIYYLEYDRDERNLCKNFLIYGRIGADLYYK